MFSSSGQYLLQKRDPSFIWFYKTNSNNVGINFLSMRIHRSWPEPNERHRLLPRHFIVHLWHTDYWRHIIYLQSSTIAKYANESDVAPLHENQNPIETFVSWVKQFNNWKIVNITMMEPITHADALIRLSLHFKIDVCRIVVLKVIIRNWHDH